jgi:nucleoside-diphosphate-sugar epimerase
MSTGQRAPLGKLGRRDTLKFALAGGTSPLAKDLADALLLNGHEVQVFSRTSKHPKVLAYPDLKTRSFDAIVNLIGGHTANIGALEVSQILALSEHLVDVAKERSTPLIHLSSGSVLGPMNSPASIQTPRFAGNPTSKYQELKIKMEQLHEGKRNLLAVSDLRLFSFAGANFLRQSDYFLSKLIKSAVDGNSIKISGLDFLRDFSGPHELASAIESAAISQFSGVANLFSEKPVSRSEILRLFADEFGVNFDYLDSSPTQEIYCASRSKELANFAPRSSLEVITVESKRALALKKSKDLRSWQ